LIRYTSEHGILQNLDAKAVMARLFRPRIMIYSALMILIVSIFFGALATRETLRVDVIRDRGMLGREVVGGLAENVYRFQLINASETPLVLSIQVQGQSPMTVLVGSSGQDPADHIEVPAATNVVLPVVVHAPIDGSTTGAQPITFVTTSTAPNGTVLTEVRETSSFIFPK
jgi:polyferredoxin